MIRIDIDMPDRCGVCFAMHSDEIGLESWCGIDETARDIYTEDINAKRPDWCPLKAEHDMPCFNCPMQPIRPTWQQGKAYCGQCGKRIPLKIKANYCHKCGREINWLP